MMLNEKEIRLLPINPRYYDIREINIKKINFSDYNIEATAKKLLNYEGDLSDLLELIRSIINNGFLYINDQVLLHLDENKEFYYILEGNRRFLAINLINRKLDINKILDDKPSYENIDSTLFSKNKVKITKILSDNPNEIKFEERWFKDVSSEEDNRIWQTIYSKHVGEQMGKRNWSRAKYFKDLLEIYKEKKQSRSKEEVINELSNLFGKKKNIIERDIKSAIWIIESIDIYNKFSMNQRIDLNLMEVSGYELVLSRNVLIKNREETVRKILGIEIDDEKLSIKFRSEIPEEKQNEIIEFLVKNSLNKNITTREIKEEIIDELGDVIGYSLTNKKTLNYFYNELKNKKKSEKLNKIEQAEIVLLENIKFSDINENEFLDENYDSKFIKSIKYMLRNDIKTLSNLKSFDMGEYPFSNLSLSIRSCIDLLILELLHRIGDDIDTLFKNLQVNSSKSASNIKKFIGDYKSSYNHDVNDVTGKLESIWGKSSIETFLDESFKLMEKKYKNRFLELSIDLESLKNLGNILLNFKIRDKDIYNNFSLLNSLVHKPYCGYEESKNSKMINNFNGMFSAVKEFLKISKIWKK